MTYSFTQNEVNTLHDIFCGITTLLPERDNQGLKLPVYCLAEEVERILSKATSNNATMIMSFSE